MLQDEYPHEVVFLKKSKVPDGGGGNVISWTKVLEFNGFMDTPSSLQIFQAHQLNNPLDRNFYFPYRNDVTPDMQCQFEGDTYELVGKPQDQGGQREVMLVPLKLVLNG
ncbi:phage head closure protein [Planococcus koreensis]|uniref:phage head closure protein n=1 Tax=Planococcus koreensis TaxID=112331 RepID=UPI0039FD4F75